MVAQKNCITPSGCLDKVSPASKNVLNLRGFKKVRSYGVTFARKDSCEKEFGHHVRLATHINFRDFVKSAGVEFYPLGGDPRVLAGYMARNKGLIPSAPGEISIQRKQLKAIIESLLPACTEPNMETGVPFRAQAIIANPPAYGELDIELEQKCLQDMHMLQKLLGYLYTYSSQCLGRKSSIIVCVCDIFFLHLFLIGRPTYEFPHPLARVPQSAANWLSYIIVDLMIWWGIRSYINDFRRRKLKLPPIAYFSMYYGSISHLPTGYMWSQHVVPKPKGITLLLPTRNTMSQSKYYCAKEVGLVASASIL
ncbi:hypothetical protein Cgig2_006800 [Carnegiea gigantea]|uniref:Glycosyltransferase family 28 N-terminal domain-containing protein n=1 Tax=Carnegiea gigantea TaxID=171969 RepID=A0A9Q1GUJ5_9CARY|nr:hypothetical protein Cgig2_006800 [Carnegiea gigantea]